MDPFERFGTLLAGSEGTDHDAWLANFSELRAAAPIGRIEALDGWLVTTHAACSEALSNSALTPDQSAFRNFRKPSADPVLDPIREKNLFTMEPSDHRRVHSLAARAFTTRAVQRLEADIESVVAETLAGVDTVGFDVAADVANVVPPAVIERILDIPECFRETFARYADAVVAGITPHLDDSQDEQLVALRRGVVAVRALISVRRDEPGGDLLSSLIRAAEDGDELDDDELVALVGAIIVGGTETTRSMIGIGMMRLLQHPEQLDFLREQAELWPSAISEILRYDWIGPALPRYCRAETEICGRQISPGDLVLVCIPAANRDPQVFDDPDCFRIDRPSQRSLAFGYGPHYCLGSHLAGAEIRISLEMLSRIGDLRLSGTPQYETDSGPTRLASLCVRAR